VQSILMMTAPASVWLWENLASIDPLLFFTFNGYRAFWGYY